MKVTAPKWNVKKVAGIISNIKTLPYKGSMIYIRKIVGIHNDTAVAFEWLLVFKGQIYSSYVLTTLAKGQTELTKEEEIQAAAFVFQGAVTTIDSLMDAEVETAKDKVIN